MSFIVWRDATWDLNQPMRAERPIFWTNSRILALGIAVILASYVSEEANASEILTNSSPVEIFA